MQVAVNNVIESLTNSTPSSQNAPIETCAYVLVTSMGGVGLSRFLKSLQEIANKNSQIKVNRHDDADSFKHKPATDRWWKDHNATSIIGKVPNWERKIMKAHYSGNVTPCFHKVLVVIGEPLHAIESTYRRFQHIHINKLKEASGQGTYKKGVTLLEIYQDIAKSGIDKTGFASYIQSWYGASRDRSNWPEIKLVTTKTLYEEAVDNAQWLGVEDKDDLIKFSRFKFDARKTKSSDASIPNDIKEKVEKVFENVTAIVRKIEANADEQVPAQIKVSCGNHKSISYPHLCMSNLPHHFPVFIWYTSTIH